jgi:disulfide bond formation protein DsbB
VRAPLVLLAGTLAVIAGFLWFQYGMGLAPCELCHWQRVPWYLGGGVFLVVWLLNRLSGRATGLGRLLMLVAGLVFLIGAGVAVYHVGVEQMWWAGPDSCTGGIATGGSIDDAVKRLMEAPVVRCDAIAWSLFGISMAGYNVFLSLALGLGALISASRMRTR